MIIHNVPQGSAAWHALRIDYRTASEAPAMMGASKQMKRNELLFAKKTGLDRDVNWWVQKYLFDRGHEYEAQARPIVEGIIGEELYPVVGTDGILLASFDGLTMLGNIIFEHKMWNEALAQAVRDKDLDPHYYWQLEQQLLVSGAEKVIFVVSDGTEDNLVWMEYFPVPGRAQALIAGWTQFDADLEAFVPTEAAVEVVGTTVTDLPSVNVQVSGQIAITDNFKVFETALRDFIDNRLVRDPKTDQDFADLDLQIKALKKAEAALDSAEAQMIAQVESVDTIKRQKEMLSKMARDNRLMAEKLLAAKKESVKLEIKQRAEKAFSDHIAAINKRIGPKIQLPAVPTDFAGAIKNKRNLASLQDAVDTELARAKIQANAIADAISINLNSLRELAVGFEFLFTDAQQLVMKDNEGLEALIKTRISEHKAAEEKRLEAERERIRAEEKEKLEKQQAAEKAEQERKDKEAADAETQRLADEQARLAALATPAPEPTPDPVQESTPEPVRQAAPAPRRTAAPVTPSNDAEPLPVWHAGLTDKLALIRYVADNPDFSAVLDVNMNALNALVRTFKAGVQIPGVKVVAGQTEAA
jgi:predicted phage-related endonuclease